MKTIIIASLVLTLSGCGGGTTPSSVDNSQAVKQAIGNIADNTPVAAPYTGSFVSINGISNGWIAGPSKHAIADGLGRTVANAPATYPELYRTLISEVGMRVTLAGARVGTGSVSGLPVYEADVTYVVKLTSGGIVAVTN